MRLAIIVKGDSVVWIDEWREEQSSVEQRSQLWHIPKEAKWNETTRKKKNWLRKDLWPVFALSSMDRSDRRRWGWNCHWSWRIRCTWESGFDATISSIRRFQTRRERNRIQQGCPRSHRYVSGFPFQHNASELSRKNECENHPLETRIDFPDSRDSFSISSSSSIGIETFFSSAIFVLAGETETIVEMSNLYTMGSENTFHPLLSLSDQQQKKTKMRRSSGKRVFSRHGKCEHIVQS